jgi:hypothetical protein
MVSPGNTYAVLIDMPNDVLTGVKRKKGIELNFDLSNKPFSRRVFHQFDSDRCDTKITKTHFVIKEKNKEAKFGQVRHDDIVLKDDLPDFAVTVETLIDIDPDFIETVLKLCKTARQSNVNQIQLLSKNGKIYFGVEKDDTSDAKVQIYGTTSKKAKDAFSMSFCRIDLKAVFNLIKSEKQKKYQIKFNYDGNLKSGYIAVVDKDKTERYILYSKRENIKDEPIKLEKKFERTPAIPEAWNYNESVEKVNANFYKWKNLTKEIFRELWIAREILSKSKSEAAKIMHGTLVPWMTWSQYCIDIGM